MSGRGRVACFVDGFNLYHAVAALRRNHLKWLDLRALAERFVAPVSEELVVVYYFTAMADWLPDRAQRHAVYLEALRATGVIPVVGNFKEKDRYCPNCGHRWIGHEEKETDVNIALGLLIGAYRDEYDRALVVSRDSDLAPAVRSVRALFPHKGITVVAPPHKGHSTELVLAAGRKTKIKLHHLEQCLLPDEMAVDGAIIRRPPTYAPPLQAVREPA